MTAFQSVEALWDSKWKVWKPGERQNREDMPGAQEDSINPFATAGNSSQWTHPSGALEDAIDVDVDEAMLSSQEMHQLEETDGADWDDLQEDATGLDHHNGDCHEDDDHLNSEEEPVLDPQQSDDAESASDAYRQIEAIRFDSDHSVAKHARPNVGRSGSQGPIRLDSPFTISLNTLIQRKAVGPPGYSQCDIVYASDSFMGPYALVVAHHKKPIIC
jgi:hypothetical protein